MDTITLILAVVALVLGGYLGADYKQKKQDYIVSSILLVAGILATSWLLGILQIGAFMFYEITVTELVQFMLFGIWGMITIKEFDLF